MRCHFKEISLLNDPKYIADLNQTAPDYPRRDAPVSANGIVAARTQCDFHPGAGVAFACVFQHDLPELKRLFL